MVCVLGLGMVMEVIVRKCKVGPLTERYMNGSYESVEREVDGVKRVAILGLDNSHNKDFKVTGASDEMLAAIGEVGCSHDELREALEEVGVWGLANWTPIEVPYGDDEWKAGFKSLPRDARQLENAQGRIRERVEEVDVLETDVSTTFWV